MSREKSREVVAGQALLGEGVASVGLLLGMVFLLLRLGVLAVAADLMIGGLLKSPGLKWLPVGLCIALYLVLFAQVVRCALRQGLAEAVAHLHQATLPTARIFMISVGALVLYVAALLVAGKLVASGVAWLWFTLLTVLLLYTLGYFAWVAFPRHPLVDRILAIS